MDRRLLIIIGFVYLFAAVSVIVISNFTSGFLPLWTQIALVGSAVLLMLFALYRNKKVVANIEFSTLENDKFRHTVVTEKTSDSLDSLSLHITASMMDLRIALADIMEIGKITSIKVGKRRFGVSNGKQASGVWHNSEWGDYGLAIDVRVGVFIVVKYKGGNYVVFNLPTAADTRIIYERLKEFVA
ncbi:hypothetical protein TALC_01472 [Thermoplasmatales archaeon BRNA1]|nr:hypothetical protein TALC_01472 [Thermoplasmatales archaeon BRNA1]